MADDFDDFFDAPLKADSPRSGAAKREDSPDRSEESSRRGSHSSRDDYDVKSGTKSPAKLGGDSDPEYTDFSDSEDDETKSEIRRKNAKDNKYSDESEDDFPDAPKPDTEYKMKRGRDKSPVEGRYSFSDGSDYSLSDTDSDVTDVSPLHTPHLSPKRKGGVNAGRPPKSPGNTREHFSQKRGSDEFKDDDEKMDLNILMQAVLEIEKNKQGQYLKDERIARSRRVLFAPTRAKAQSRKNFSFSNDKVSTIDKENERLMEKIMKMAVEGKQVNQKRPKKKTPARLTPSAVNRLREQRKIEQENLALLKRLQTAKASNTVKRDKLLKDYEGKTIAGQSVAAAHDLVSPSGYRMHMLGSGKHSYYTSDIDTPSSVVLQDRGVHYRARPSSAVTYIGAETQHGTANVVLQSKRHARPTSASTTHSYGTRSSRPTSAKQRPGSALSGQSRKSGSGSRPAWDSSW